MTIIYTVITRNKKSILCEYTEYNGNFQQISLHLLNKLQDENYQETEIKNFLEKSLSNNPNMIEISKFSIIYDMFKFYVINQHSKIDKKKIHFQNEIEIDIEKEKKSSKNSNDDKDLLTVPLMHHQTDLEIINNLNYNPNSENIFSFMCLVDKENDNEELILTFLNNLIFEFFHFYSKEKINAAQAYSLKDFVIVLKNEMHKYNKKIGGANGGNKNKNIISDKDNLLPSASMDHFFKSEQVGKNKLI
jgi:hypothetical protein